MDHQRGRFLGIGVGTYARGHNSLPHAVGDVVALRELIGAGFEGDPVGDPTGSQVWDLLEALPDSVESGPLLALWSGHATAVNNDLRLLAADSGRQPSAGISASEVALRLADSGASQILFIVDACFAGEAALPAIKAANAILRERPPEGPRVWVGVLASCQDVERAQDGELGRRLRRLLAEGPTSPQLRVRWSVHNERISGDDLCDAVIKEWDSDAQRPAYHGTGNAWWMLPNPLHRADAPEQVVEHLLLAARGGARRDVRSWFTGRTVEVDEVVGWLRVGGRARTWSPAPRAPASRRSSAGWSACPTRPNGNACNATAGGTGPRRGLGARPRPRPGTDRRPQAEVLEPQLTRARRLRRRPTAATPRAGRAGAAGGRRRGPAVWRPPVMVVDGMDEAARRGVRPGRGAAAAPVPVRRGGGVATRDLSPAGRRGRAGVALLSPDGPGLEPGRPRTPGRTAPATTSRTTSRPGWSAWTRPWTRRRWPSTSAAVAAGHGRRRAAVPARPDGRPTSSGRRAGRHGPDRAGGTGSRPRGGRRSTTTWPPIGAARPPAAEGADARAAARALLAR